MCNKTKQLVITCWTKLSILLWSWSPLETGLLGGGSIPPPLEVMSPPLGEPSADGVVAPLSGTAPKLVRFKDKTKMTLFEGRTCLA